MMKYLYYITLVILFYSCIKGKDNVDISEIKLDLEITRTEQLLFTSDSVKLNENIDFLKKEHTNFMDIYSNYVLNIGLTDIPDYENYLKLFIRDTVISRVADTAVMIFSDFSKIENSIEKGFRHYKYYFPNNKIPNIYTCLSGFNQSIFTSDDIIGISLDKYLGADCPFYEYLGIPQYKSANMYPDKIAADLFYSWYVTNYPYSELSDNLLSNIIYQGKAMYFSKAMLPETPDSVIFGYTAKQIKWCKNNEASMWTFLVENKLLYDVERLTLQKYTGEAPFTNTFSNESPGKTGVWIGWRIVQSFMEKNSEMTLPQLLTIKNSQEILNMSGYFPE